MCSSKQAFKQALACCEGRADTCVSLKPSWVASMCVSGMSSGVSSVA